MNESLIGEISAKLESISLGLSRLKFGNHGNQTIIV
jgi:hypothetical protein